MSSEFRSELPQPLGHSLCSSRCGGSLQNSKFGHILFIPINTGYKPQLVLLIA